MGMRLEPSASIGRPPLAIRQYGEWLHFDLSTSCRISTGGRWEASGVSDPLTIIDASTGSMVQFISDATDEETSVRIGIAITPWARRKGTLEHR